MQRSKPLSLVEKGELQKRAPRNERPLAAWSDEELMAAYARTHRRDVFTELVRRYERELYSYLRRYLGDPQLAEDVFQATFLQVHIKCDQYEPGRPFRPWLYTIATHQAIDAQRRLGRQPAVSLDRTIPTATADNPARLADMLVSSEEQPDELAAEQEGAESVRRALAQLTEPMRQVINLVYYQGLKYREAAEVLSVPVGTVKSRMHAAIARLADIWKKQSAAHRADNSPEAGKPAPGGGGPDSQ